jgi:mono/diheme cytochrome c family protein
MARVCHHRPVRGRKDRRLAGVVALTLGLGVFAHAACVERPGEEPEPTPISASEPLVLDDDPLAYVTRSDYRRSILERDLVDREPTYARVRLRHYSRNDERGWDRLPVVDWPTQPLTVALAQQIAADKRIPELEFGSPLSATYGDEQSPQLPSTQAEWIALGERVFFEFPMLVAPSVGRALREGSELRDYGVIVHDDRYVGLGLAEVEGRTRVVVTCASCHASLGADGRPSGVRANRAYDHARLRLDHGGTHEAALVDTTRAEDLDKLGPGRSDVQHDQLFNPYAFPDFGGLVDMPYLHHTANWYHRGVASLAIRVETVFMSHGRNASRPPRVLMWALAEYLRSLPPPPPSDPSSPASERGRVVFEQQACDVCHTPPLYSSELRPTLEEIGTDDAAGRSPIRGTGRWRVPSLRGVGGNGPYLHHGAVATLEQLFDPQREEPGHGFGLELDAAARADLIAFLRTI